MRAAAPAIPMKAAPMSSPSMIVFSGRRPNFTAAINTATTAPPISASPSVFHIRTSVMLPSCDLAVVGREDSADGVARQGNAATLEPGRPRPGPVGRRSTFASPIGHPAEGGRAPTSQGGLAAPRKLLKKNSRDILQPSPFSVHL